MKNVIKSILKTILPASLVERYIARRNAALMDEWNKNGRKGVAPQFIKQGIVSEYQKRFNLKTLVETGTYLGDMIFVQKNNFDRLISIELDKKLFARAVKRFRADKHVELHQGDSGILLENILKTIHTPCLFWLDGHYSGGFTSKGSLTTPIAKELRTILSQPHKHVVLIDDARLFNGEDDYPTISELKNLIKELRPNYIFEEQYDIIRVHE